MWRSKSVKVFDAVDKAVAAWLKAFTALIKVFTALIKVFTALVNVLTVLLKIFVVSVDVKKIRSSQWFEHRDFHATGDRCVLYFDAHIARKINPLCAEETVVTVRICTACSPWWRWWCWWPRPGCTTAATRRGWTAGTRGGARRSWCGPPSTRRGAGGSTRECPEPGDPAIACDCVLLQCGHIPRRDHRHPEHQVQGREPPRFIRTYCFKSEPDSLPVRSWHVTHNITLDCSSGSCCRPAALPRDLQPHGRGFWELRVRGRTQNSAQRPQLRELSTRPSWEQSQYWHFTRPNPPTQLIFHFPEKTLTPWRCEV